MIQTYSPTIRRKEMEAVLTCMVDEKIGPGEMSAKLIQVVKEYMGCDGAVALRSPALAVEYALNSLAWPKESGIIISALAPAYQIQTLEKLGYRVLVADVCEATGLVTPDTVGACMDEGGRLLLLHETNGILPDIKSFIDMGLTIIEDISHSALASYPLDEDVSENPETAKADSSETPDGSAAEEKFGKKAGMHGVYAILSMEDKDTITSGGGALLIAPERREWIPLKHYAESQPEIDFLPDMNSALAFVAFKEFNRNEKSREDLFSLFSRAVMAGRHKTYLRPTGRGSTIYGFPLVLNSGFRDVRAYAQKKNIDVRQAYENSVIALRQEELSSRCICANSLLLRCAMFPLYPRLSQKEASQIVKVLSSLP